nr:retrovirus-related Pol polyprotein from transposon TNT 1-94 [Tanacetum cinerariifolium]
MPKSSDWRANNTLELIHSDVCSPIKPVSRSGNRYILSFIDDFSRKGWVYLLKDKSEVFERFKLFKNKVENKTGNKIKALRQLTASFTAQQNGVAERKNRTVMNMVVTLLAAKNMPKEFWAEAVVWSYYILNRCSTKELEGITPYEAWHGVKPNVKSLRVWGCLAHAHVPKEKRSKLESKSKCCIMVGRSEEFKAYRLIDLTTITVVISRDVVFEEDKQWNWEHKDDGDVLTWENCEEIMASSYDEEDTVDNETPTVCIGVKWLYKVKVNGLGEIGKYKARLVAKGYGQEYRIDYTEVYAPVARMDTIRLMIAIAAQKG